MGKVISVEIKWGHVFARLDDHTVDEEGTTFEMREEIRQYLREAIKTLDEIDNKGGSPLDEDIRIAKEYYDKDAERYGWDKK